MLFLAIMNWRKQILLFLTMPLFLALQSTKSNGQKEVRDEPAEPIPPPVVFSTMLWGEGSSQTFSYAPWDNHEEENATRYEVSATAGFVSKKFAYYGKGTLQFHKADEISDEDFIEDENSSAPKPPSPILASCKFQITPGQTKEYILLVAPKNDEEGTANVYVIPFDQASIPTGSFSFSSRASKTIYVQFGKSKFALPPKQTVVKEAQTEENARIIPLKVYLKNGGKYETVMSKEWPHAKGLRGLVYLTETSSGVEVTRIADFPQSIEQSIGYDCPPLILRPEDNKSSER
jgi:hypothetical protein